MYISVCTHTYTRARGGTRLHTCTHRHTHIRTDTLTYTHVQVRTRTHRPTHPRTHTHAPTCAHARTHTHTYTHTHARTPITVMNIDNNYTTSFAHICQALAVLDVEGRCAGCAEFRSVTRRVSCACPSGSQMKRPWRAAQGSVTAWALLHCTHHFSKRITDLVHVLTLAHRIIYEFHELRVYYYIHIKREARQFATGLRLKARCSVLLLHREGCIVQSNT
jgi:hypothetical protein